ncbi:hypothetical protein O3M35_009436 [Rhynocoris fuscipes]|uniref:C2H2-type domain-containing protein n=1 Tax=Rhynocoris fuscipes TaxID=488301 RepID=A0AAW1D2W4_9HEMI
MELLWSNNRLMFNSRGILGVYIPVREIEIKVRLPGNETSVHRATSPIAKIPVLLYSGKEIQWPLTYTFKRKSLLQSWFTIDENGTVSWRNSRPPIEFNLSAMKTPKRVHYCHYCTYVSDKLCYIKFHEFHHIGGRPFTCLSCFKPFLNVTSYKRHLKKHKLKEMRVKEDKELKAKIEDDANCDGKVSEKNYIPYFVKGELLEVDSPELQIKGEEVIVKIEE